MTSVHDKSAPVIVAGTPEAVHARIRYVNYDSEKQLPLIRQLIDRDLSEPYSILTYRYFVNNWPRLTIMAMLESDVSGESAQCVGVIVCKLSTGNTYPSLCGGYIAMLSVSPAYRGLGLASQLVSRALDRMKEDGGDLCSLETELSNHAAISLYEKFNFVRDVRLPRYYLNGSDAFRLKLWFTTPAQRQKKHKLKLKAQGIDPNLAHNNHHDTQQQDQQQRPQVSPDPDGEDGEEQEEIAADQIEEEDEWIEGGHDRKQIDTGASQDLDEHQ